MKLRVAVFALSSLFVAASSNAFSQDQASGLSPDKSEIESASGSNIVFVSYEGPSSRIDSLAERANNGVLSEEERAEYEAFINAGDFISILKLKARRHLDLNRC